MTDIFYSFADQLQASITKVYLEIAMEAGAPRKKRKELLDIEELIKDVEKRYREGDITEPFAALQRALSEVECQISLRSGAGVAKVINQYIPKQQAPPYDEIRNACLLDILTPFYFDRHRPF